MNSKAIREQLAKMKETRSQFINDNKTKHSKASEALQQARSAMESALLSGNMEEYNKNSETVMKEEAALKFYEDANKKISAVPYFTADQLKAFTEDLKAEQLADDERTMKKLTAAYASIEETLNEWKGRADKIDSVFATLNDMDREYTKQLSWAVTVASFSKIRKHYDVMCNEKRNLSAK